MNLKKKKDKKKKKKDKTMPYPKIFIKKVNPRDTDGNTEEEGEEEEWPHLLSAWL